MPLLLRDAISFSPRRLSRRRRSIACVLLHFLILILAMASIGATMAPTQTQTTFPSSHAIAPRSLRFIAIDTRDKIIELQCHVQCGENLNCRDKCYMEKRKSERRGHCAQYENINQTQQQQLQQQTSDLTCMNTCSYDYDCPEVQKCCRTHCGPVCSIASGLREDLFLPEIPKIIEHRLPRGNKVIITIASAVNTTHVYHVEARSHIGLLYAPRKMGAWHWQPVYKIAEQINNRYKKIEVQFSVKPGRWYEVRVAAINGLGFRGYSDPLPFTSQKRPKPPKPPADLKVVSTQANDKYFEVKIVWCPSKSNLPVEKYKITWSLYVKSKGDSLVSNESFVKDAHQFLITKLLPDSSYYIQVQAISTLGRRRLKSDKKSILYNTTSIARLKRVAVQPYEPLKCSNNHHDYQHMALTARKSNLEIRNLKENFEDHPATTSTTTTEANSNAIANPQYEVRYRMNRKLGMIVQISGFRPRRERVYELCPKEINCEKREYSAFRAKKNSLEFSKLKYDTTYMLKAFCTVGTCDGSINNPNKPFNFTTPKCESFKKHFPKMEIQC